MVKFLPIQFAKFLYAIIQQHESQKAEEKPPIAFDRNSFIFYVHFALKIASDWQFEGNQVLDFVVLRPSDLKLFPK